jgi:hypothetical protein
MENPFAAIGAPPETDDVREQLLYLERVLEAFQKTPHPRLKPLRRQLCKAIENLGLAVQRGDPPEEIARRFTDEARDLRRQTYELVLTVVNQFRATLRAKLQAGMAAPQRTDMELLQKGLREYAHAVRTMVSAMRNNDDQAAKAAGAQMELANALLNQSGKQYAQGLEQPGAG